MGPRQFTVFLSRPFSQAVERNCMKIIRGEAGVSDGEGYVFFFFLKEGQCDFIGKRRRGLLFFPS